MPAGLRTPAYLSCSRAARNPSEQVGNRATCRDQDPERFFPEPGEQTKAAEAKAIRAGWQVPNHCRDLAVKADGGIDADRAEAERAFRLAERLGSVRDGRNAPVGWAVLFEG